VESFQGSKTLNATKSLFARVFQDEDSLNGSKDSRGCIDVICTFRESVDFVLSIHLAPSVEDGKERGKKRLLMLGD
jgi:hypothetical protein